MSAVHEIPKSLKGLEVTEYQPTAPMDLEPLGPPAVGQMRKASWLQQLDRIERKLDSIIDALAEEEEPQGTLDESGPVDPGKVQGL